MHFIKLCFIYASISFVYAQEVDTVSSGFAVYTGFLDIKADSLGVPLFIDGVFIGETPILEPIPVLPGFHEVSYIPPNIQQEKVRDNLTEGIKRVYVAKNDTLNVFLFYDHYLSQVEELETEFKIQNYIGASLVAVLVFVIFSIF